MKKATGHLWGGVLLLLLTEGGPARALVTPPDGNDTTPPIAAISQPAPHQIITNPSVQTENSNIAVTASDDTSVARVEVWVDTETHVQAQSDFPTAGFWGTTTSSLSSAYLLAPGLHTLNVQSFDENDNASAIVSEPIILDTPILSNALTVYASSATIQVVSALPIRLRVDYSTSFVNNQIGPAQSAYSADGVYSTSVNLTLPTLPASQTYYYTFFVYLNGTAAPYATNSLYQFTTPNPSDTTPPVVGIKNPSASMIVPAGSTLFSGTASDNMSFSRVDVWVDSGTCFEETADTATPGSWLVDAGPLFSPNPPAIGPHTFFAEAFDENDNPSAVANQKFYFLSPLESMTALPFVSSAAIQMTAGLPVDLQVYYSSAVVNGSLAGDVHFADSPDFGTLFSTATTTALPNLNSGTTYFYKISVQPASGAGYDDPALYQFTTVFIPGPALVNLTPSAATQNDPDTSLTITGSRFENGAAVLWNGSPLVTQFVSASQLTATIPAADLMTLQSATIGVRNPDGGLSSAALSFNVLSAVGTQQFANLNAVHVYPNPWNKGRTPNAPITFEGFTSNATVKLFTVSGHLIKTLNTANGSAVWDLTNNSGSGVASGLYLYLINAGDDKKLGKLAIIK